MSTIPISFRLLSLQPDKRQYKTASPELEPVNDLFVVVRVPDKNEYIDNLSDMSLKAMSGEPQPLPQLTPLGLAYVEDQLLARIDKEEVKSDEVEWEEDK